MDNNAITQIKDLIEKSKSIGIVAAKSPSLDQMAAALGLYLLLKTANKNVSIAAVDEPLVENASLVGIDKVGKSFSNTGGTGDLTVSFPYTEGEIEKVSYTLEEGYLNIIVKAAAQGLTFNEKDVEYSRGGGTLDLVFAVGVASLNDLDLLFDTQNPDIRIINIDNNKLNEQYGDINLVSDRLSSISEGIADLALSLELHIDEDSAQNLFSGIISATENFQAPKTSSLAFEMASLLMKKGATRIVSENARRGIKLENQPQNPTALRPLEPARSVPSASSDKINRPAVSTSRQTQDKKEQDRIRFEENLQKRVAEEKAREAAAQSRNTQPSRNQQIENKNQSVNEAVDADDAPTDWLAPKVYKGSSEV